jgi:ketosteroid isomerase-like protein
MDEPLEHFRWLYDVRGYTDRAGLAERWDPELVINQDPGLSSGRRTYRGANGLAELIRELTDHYAEQWWEPKRVVEAPDGRWVVLLDVRGRGRVSRVPVELQIGHVVTLRNDRILRADAYVGWDAALEAAGVAASDES